MIRRLLERWFPPKRNAITGGPIGERAAAYTHWKFRCAACGTSNSMAIDEALPHRKTPVCLKCNAVLPPGERVPAKGMR